MIHAIPKRMWYVENYLIPSMTAQGIARDSISVYNDEKHEGNLRACLNAFMSVPDDSEGTWHIQDDTVICKNFKARTEMFDFGLVCGFSTELYDGTGHTGAVKIQDMWFSFPCIRIPNQYARECAKWVDESIIGNPVYKDYWKNGKNDDWAFRLYLKTFHKDECAINIAPNLVDHIDYLIGGTSSGNERKKLCRAQYWEDEDVVAKLQITLLKEKQNG